MTEARFGTGNREATVFGILSCSLGFVWSLDLMDEELGLLLKVV
jgi:hypothetical protein